MTSPAERYIVYLMKNGIFSDFMAGAACVVRGCGAFYGDRQAWKYVLLPWGVMIAAYAVFFRAAFVLTDRLTAAMDAFFAGLPSYLAWLGTVCGGLTWLFAGLLALMLPAVTISAFYAAVGGIFFDALAGHRLRTGSGLETMPFAWGRTIRFMWSSFLFALETAVVGGAVFLLSFFLPVVGPVLLAAVFGAYLALSLMIGAANCRGMTLRELRRGAREHRFAVLGFGVTAYLLLLIPFSMLVLLPGLVMGATDLFAACLCDPPQEDR